MKIRRGLTPLSIALTFIIVGFIWIFLSDTLINYVATNMQSIHFWQTIKGSVFILGTGGLIWYMVKEYAQEYQVNQHKLEQALQEKEILVQELHHRVKNNLAVISGLLEVQGFQVENDQIQRFITESMMRIQSIAFVHERLYETESFTRIANTEFVEKLIRKIQAIYKTEHQGITINKHMEEFTLDINQAVPMALLLNELLTNAFSHAFNNQSEGTVFIEMTQGTEHISLAVEDNGKGLPEDFDLEGETNIGSMLIRILTNQLKGEINYTTKAGEGTRFHLKFPRKAVKGSSSTMQLAS